MKFSLSDDTTRRAVIQYISKLPDGKQYDVSITPHRSRRSVSQNSLLWLWIKCIADDTGGDKDQINEELKAMFLPKKEVVGLHGELHLKPVSTTGLNTTQFGAYLERIQTFSAIELGITLPSPEDLIFEAFYEQYENHL